jgi:hypothetical protein
MVTLKTKPKQTPHSVSNLNTDVLRYTLLTLKFALLSIQYQVQRNTWNCVRSSAITSRCVASFTSRISWAFIVSPTPTPWQPMVCFFVQVYLYRVHKVYIELGKKCQTFLMWLCHFALYECFSGSYNFYVEHKSQLKAQKNSERLRQFQNRFFLFFLT